MPNSAPVYCQPNPTLSRLVRQVGVPALSLLLVDPLLMTLPRSRPPSHDPLGMRTHGPLLLRNRSVRGISPGRAPSSRRGRQITTPPRSSPRRRRTLALGCTARSWRTILLWQHNVLTEQVPFPFPLGVPQDSCETTPTLFTPFTPLVALNINTHIPASETICGYEYPHLHTCSMSLTFLFRFPILD